jgi:hypothetical protein
VLEQHAEITIFDLAKDKLSRALPHGVHASGSLRYRVVADRVGLSAGDVTRAGVAWAAEMLTSSG